MAIYDFLKLPESEKEEAYNAMSPHDQLLVRMQAGRSGRTTGYREITKEEKERSHDILMNLINKSKK